MHELWTDKYFPKSLSEFVGNSEIVRALDSWANEWNSGKQGKRESPFSFMGKQVQGKQRLRI
ncbi:MAG: hypothetical protein J4415_03690 [Candidatus Diapherotrites archaeon]|uniref:Uncharacterized protein n=1 Tax=Candidatus Iainarchaeum sp. TaxID=3101447 RepID=A0A8T4KTJ3_9ARCH|nr:hypothetical protein [Candidatus Diapherotrites archaeon]